MTDSNDSWWLAGDDRPSDRTDETGDRTDETGDRTDERGDRSGETDTTPLPHVPASATTTYADGPPFAAPPGAGHGGPSRWVSLGLAAALLVVGGAVGAGATTLLWRRLSNGTGSSRLPTVDPFRGFGDNGPFGGDGQPSGGGSGGSGSSTGPADAASIAQHVNNGVVDITVSSGYQGFQGAGTGMVLTSTGEVLTNNHVVDGATSITATDVGNGRTYDAKVVGYDVSHDVAVIQLSGASGLATVPLGDSSKLRVGASVVAVGNAEGRGGTPSYAGGTVTALDRSITASDPAAGTSEPLSGLIETDADVVSGDSGGPLVNTGGQVIGMDTAASSGFRFDIGGGRGFAVPINTALGIARQIESGAGSASVHLGPTAFLGVDVQGSDSLGNGGSGTPGAVIANVVDGGPAASAGLTTGDVITSVDGHAVTSADSLMSVMLGEHAGATVTVTYVDQSGQQQSASVTLAGGPAR